ncbi:kinesin-like protein KIF13B isoform X1 [Anarrhichthys ocellatus]|uniref:kinesin-like protein KIF13B isoform X1 n=1 Tax=Anarrhichthys ocellatus TaxID=433405 RepID=UPI0012EDC34A|nr:kinesin-like protein KIF13B isoform X1 [Anarrhichthys ocellatus]XP_031733158.1 kinesin-like protein KIF13B isoform X1 [Anarrhichthys ocellatus]XP_031733159.1 kinesin-like protein KIF13B isoform X1 [Anarrhichthys ocellatus]
MDDNSLNDSNVKVAVRVRPMNRREKDLKTKCVVEMEGNQTVLHPAITNVGKGDPRNQPKVFAYDHCFWSIDESQKDKFAGQDVVFQSLGESLLDNAFMGYNACIFAYGQTGSGKSYTMMGSAEQPGLIPRLCSSLFSRTVREAREGECFTVEVSFMEIYNEKVRDLLDPKGNRQALRVREHKVMGPYVDGLSRLAVACYKDIESLMSEGNKSRTVAATNMNEESSRSHAVFNIILTHTLTDLKSETSGEKVSKLGLVDLAGSERAAKTGAAGERLKEGSNINKSLSTLGLVISALADQGAGKYKSKFVPYRDSVLTWLLKDSLGGNSRTAMVATISPSADNYDETLSTLRYADRAKSIVNHAIVNEDPNARIIRQLREEVEKLKEQLTEAESMKAPDLKDRLEESEKLIQEMTVTWEDKLTKTEAIAQERQRQLESLGISLQSSGIRVVDDKCFLVNLNADPALNELLVYYLKEHTRVGSADSQDIQLCGMAIQAEHCVIDISEDDGVVLSPHRNARTCVNGAAVSSPVQLHHGDRILWGNNHFFRINLPRHMVHAGGEDEEGGAAMKTCLSTDRLEADFDTASDVSSELSFGYEFAQAEVMMKGMGNNDPLQSVLQTLERQHEEEKRCALERQRQMYEQELQQLRQRLTPEKPSHLLDPTGPPSGAAAAAAAAPSSQKRVRRWSEDREAMMTRSLRRLREQIVRANLLAQEAGFIAEELSKRTEYLVTLQIPAANLDANRKRDAVLSEPAIQVRRKGKGKQIWALEKMENRLVDMRELYQEWKDFDEDNPVMRSYFKRADPFFDEQENHSLIGVANVFLACLFHDVKLQYAVPIINQTGEVAGRLHVELWRGTEGSEEKGPGRSDIQLSDTDGDPQERRLDCVVKILHANGLPRHLSNFVFCQYHFWGEEESVFIAPEMQPSSSSSSRDPQCTVVFDSAKELSVPVSEDFLEYLADGAVAIEVYGHKQANHRRNLALWDLGVIQAKTRTLRERWSEVTRHLELWVQLMELNEAGEFTAVEVLPAKDVRTGGVFQLRQGQSRRVQVEVRSVPDSGTMPLIAASILSVSIGDVKVRQISKGSGSQWAGDEEMDSYQEVDLERMREHWLLTLNQRQEYLDQQLQKIVCKPDKSEDDVERESQLLECRLTLTEERNAVLVPSAGSGIPGAPGERVPVPGMETHIPVLFLDLSADDFQSSLLGPLAGGLDALLSGEEDDDFFDLHVVKHYDPEVKAEASWDSTVHECPQLSRVASADQRVYLTVSAVVQLSHPAHMQLVLRKRVCVNVTGKQGFAQSLLKRMSQRSTIPGSGVTFEIVSNIPGDIHGPEDREMLARLAASTEGDQSADREAAIEKYLRSVLAVENILTLDRLRQEVAVREQLAVRGKASRRCLSSPNINRLSASSLDLYSSTHRLNDFKGWESHQDLSFVPPSSRRTLPSSISQNLSPETVHSGFAASYLSPVKAVPKLLKSLLPGGRGDGWDQAAVHHQQSVPRIMVQSASVEEGLSKHQQPVAIEEIILPNFQTESPRSMPLPPPIIPETEEPALSPVSEASSGYMSTSLSTAMLSDVYTLSWDLPVSSGSRTNGFDVVPNEETQCDTYSEFIHVDQSEPWESLLVLDDEAAEERTDSPESSKPDDTPSDSNLKKEPQEPDQSLSAQLMEQGEPDSAAESDLICQTKQMQDSAIDHIGSEQLDNSEPLKDSLLVQEKETKQTESSQTEELELAATDETEAEVSAQEVQSQSETIVPQQPKQDQTTLNSAQDPAPHLVPAVSEVLAASASASEVPAVSEVLVPAPAPCEELVLLALSKEQATSEASNPGGTSMLTSSSTTDEVQQETPANVSKKATSAAAPSPPSVQTLKPDASVANPFKIQKVKSSDLKSFHCIVGVEEEKKPAQVDRTSSLNLSVPMESLEIISDSEEGDAAAVLPDWLKEGEFVTVGNNKSGTVQYVGPTDFAEGTWVGVELEVPAGKNDGSVGGKHYFHCNPGYGVLVRPDRVSRAGGKRRRQQQKRRSANLSGSSPNLAALTALAKGEGGGASTGRPKGENRKSWNT